MTLNIASCTVDVAPDPADAGTTVEITARVATDPPAELDGGVLLIRDAYGTTRAEASFVEFDGEANRTASASVPVPTEPGTYAWHAAVVFDGSETGLEAPVPITVFPHRSRLQVWDVPSTIEAGGAFRIKLGLKCSAGCPLTGRDFAICDAQGNKRAEGTVPGDLWPGSEGLHYAEVDLVAPEATGLAEWQAHVAPDDGAPPHEGAKTAFGVRTVAPADCTVRVEAVDQRKEAPLSGMSVVMHPYRARTDDGGIAEIHVARGSYRIFVSGRGYYPVQREIEVTGDVTERAPLEAEPPPSKDW